MDKDKEKALDLAVSQIERQFGKGSIMRLGEAHARHGRRVDPDRLDRPGHRARRRRHPARPGHRDLRPRVVG